MQLVRSADRDAAVELVRQPGLIPLVILRGSGETTRSLAAAAAECGVRTLAHADGGGVLYLDRAADPALATELIVASLDRLGVCNRLNLLLICSDVWDQWLPSVLDAVRGLGVTPSLPPHAHPLGHEWALDTGHEATVTIAPADGPAAAAGIANASTSGLAASIVTADPAAAAGFLGRVPGDRRLLERQHPAAGRLQAARCAGDRHQRGPRARPARPGDVPGPVPPPVRGHPGLRPVAVSSG